jgi:hypothetical protein
MTGDNVSPRVAGGIASFSLSIERIERGQLRHGLCDEYWKLA